MTPAGFTTFVEENGEKTMIYKYSNSNLDKFFETPHPQDFIHVNYLKYIAHIVRRPNSHPTKKALFIQPERSHAPTIFTKIRFFLNNIDEEQIVKEMNDWTKFQNLLKVY